MENIDDEVTSIRERAQKDFKIVETLMGRAILDSSELYAVMRAMHCSAGILKSHLETICCVEKVAEVSKRAEKCADVDEGETDTHFNVSYLSLILVDLIKSLTVYANVNQDSVCGELRIIAEWPCVMSSDFEWDIRNLDAGKTRYDWIAGHLGKRFDSTMIGSADSRFAQVLEEMILLRMKAPGASELPWFLDNENMNGGARVSYDDFDITHYPEGMAIPGKRGSGFEANQGVQKSLIKMASAMRYFLYMTVSPLPMRAWHWGEWMRYRVVEWKRITGEEVRREPSSCEGKYPLTYEMLQKCCGVDEGNEGWKEINFGKGCRYYFGDFKDFLSLPDARGNNTDKEIHARFERFCRKIIDGYLRWKGEPKGIEAKWLTRNNRLRISEVPKPPKGWARFLSGEAGL